MEDSPLLVNPLYNPLILKLIYQHLDFPNKKTFRLVCKTWIDTILDHWRKHTKLVICNRLNFSFLVDRSNNARVTTFKNCFPMFNLDHFNLYKIREKPLLNLKLQAVGFSYLPVHLDQLKNKNIEEDFLNFQSLILERFAPSLEELQTFCCPFLEDQRQEAGFRKLLLNDFPNLKVLSMTPYVNENPGMYTVCKNSFPKAHSDLTSFTLFGGGYSQGTSTIFLNLMPNLKKLKLIGGCSDILAALKYPLSPSPGGKYLLLENLEVEPERDQTLTENIRPWLLEYLEAARPPLKTLKGSVTFRAPGPLQPFLYKIIWSCLEHTLTRLKLRVYTGWSWSTLLTGSSLPNLTHLYLRFCVRRVRGVRFDFGMLKGTPQLRVLHLILEEISQYRGVAVVNEKNLVWNPNQEEERTRVFLEHLEDFRFEMEQELTESIWRVVAGFMPNLLKIQALMDETTFPLVIQLWPGLKHCILHGNNIKQGLISKIGAQNEKIKIELARQREGAFEWDEW